MQIQQICEQAQALNSDASEPGLQDVSKPIPELFRAAICLIAHTIQTGAQVMSWHAYLARHACRLHMQPPMLSRPAGPVLQAPDSGTPSHGRVDPTGQWEMPCMNFATWQEDH